MEQFILDQIRYGLRYLPLNLAKSFFIPRSSAETRALRRREFLCGVCHPTENFDQLREANIRWTRFDAPFPFNADGSESESYRNYKEKCRRFADHGIKVMAITPFAREFIENGIDPRTAEGEKEVIRVAEFLIEDLGKCVGGIQIANEIGIPRFTLPLTMEESARFLGIQAKAMYPHRGDVLIGYNSAGPAADLHALMQPYLGYIDYVGIDIYLGCFDNYPGFMFLFDALLRYLWAFTKKPVIVQEYGYISEGAPKSKAEKRAILQSYGVNSKKEAAKDIEAFVSRLPKDFAAHVPYLAKNDVSRYYDLVFNSDLRQHLYKEMPPQTRIPGYPHTPEGQAKFFNDTILRFYNTPFVGGVFVYCYKDSETCYICGQHDCPVETRWGLVDRFDNPKPSFYAVKRRFGRIGFCNAAEKKAGSAGR